MKIIIYFFAFFFSFKVYSNPLSDQLKDFLKNKYSIKKNVHIIIRNGLKKNTFCKNPHFSVLNNFHSINFIDILLDCENKHHFLKIELQEKGEYIVAKRKIPRGTKIQESDLKIVKGRIDKLPINAYLNKKDVVNRVNLRDIFPLQPITSFITRPFWLVRVNQKITIIIQNKNFLVFSTGTSLTNSAANQKARIKTKNGNIIIGTVNKNGEVIVMI